VGALWAGWPLYLALLVSIIFLDQSRTVKELQAESPLGSLRADRRLFLWRLVFFFVLMSGYLLWATRFEWAISLWGGAFMCLLILKTSAWWGYTMATTALAARRVLPKDLVGFLDGAGELGLVRRVGVSFEFHHPTLQDYIADHGNRLLRSRGDSGEQSAR
jgi:hypothetical protein